MCCRSNLRVCLWLLLAWFCPVSLTQAQEPQATPPAAADSSKTATDAGQQTVYVPYTKLREVFEKEGRGVFLPYSEFRRLWDAAHAKPAVAEQTSPVDALISEIESDAAIEQDVVRVRATLTIELLKKGWLQIPLRLGDVALQQATLDNQAARVIPSAAGGYQLLIQHADNNPQTLKLNLEYAKAFTKSPGLNRVEIDAPAAPVNRWRIHVAQAGVKINVQPYIAATDAPADAPTDADTSAKTSEPAGDTDTNPAPTAEQSVLLALVGAAPKVIIDWTPKSEGASGMTALATTQVTQELFISETSLRTRANVRYDISRSSLDKLVIDVPADHKIVNVFDANVRKWQVETVDNNQRITIELFEPATAQQNVALELEKIIEQSALSDIAAPTISAVDVGRQQGMLVVNVDPVLRAEVTTRTGLTQLDTAELPPQLSAQPWTFAYRYAALPIQLRVSLVKVQPRITVNQLVVTQIRPDLMAIDTRAIFDIAEAGLFQLEFDLPADFIVRDVIGSAYADAAAAQIDSYHLDTTRPNHLIVNLSKKAIGKVSLEVKLEQKLTDANLQSPTGTPANLPLVVPKASQEFITRLSGQLLLLAPESLRINPQSTSGLRPVSLSEVADPTILQQSDPRFPNRNLAVAFAFSDQPISGTLATERRKPFITAKQRLLAEVESGVIRFQSQLIYDINFSGVNSLRIDIPAALADEITNETTSVRESIITPAPGDLAPGYVAWNLAGQSEMIGRQVVTLSWEQKLDELAVGKSLEVSLPYLKPRNIDRAWGQIVITKAEALDVQPSGQLVGIRPIDPHHDVMPEAAVPNAARAFEFHDDWTLSLGVTRYQLEEIKHTSIERALVRAVLTRSGQVGVQALYRLRSAHQRLTVRLPPGAQFDAQPARLNGNPVSLERGDKDELFIPMSGFEPDQSLILELRYSLDEFSGRLDIPHFPDDPATQRVFLNLFLPKEQALIGWTGPWTEQWKWRDTDFLTWSPVNERSDDELESWLKEGTNSAASPPFQRDGTLYSFATLKPQPPPDGSLSLVTTDSRILTGGVLLLMAIIAVTFLRSPLKLKIVVIVSVLLICILIGVFASSLAGQLMNFPIMVSLSVACLLWIGWYGYTWADRSVSARSAAPVTAQVQNTPSAADSSTTNVTTPDGMAPASETPHFDEASGSDESAPGKRQGGEGHE